MPAHERLSWYAQHFEMVEVNSTFYAVPDLRMVERWCAITPDQFTFDVKLHQLLSRHSTAAKLLPPELRRRAEIDMKGKVKLTPEIEEAVARAFLHSIAFCGPKANWARFYCNFPRHFHQRNTGSKNSINFSTRRENIKSRSNCGTGTGRSGTN